MLASDITGDDRPLRGAHPDVTEWNPEQKRESLLDTLERAYTRPSEARWPVLILTGLERASENLLGVLLKTLEETQDRVVFLLTATEVLDVVASRCVRVSFGHRGTAVRQEILELLGISDAARRAAVFPTVGEAAVGDPTQRALLFRRAAELLQTAGTIGKGEFLAAWELATADVHLFLEAAVVLDGRAPVIAGAIRAGEMLASGVPERHVALHLLTSARALA